MNTKVFYSLASPLLFSVLILACQPIMPALSVFQPENEDLLRLTFSYPNNWEMQRNPYHSKTSDGISASAPYQHRGIMGISVWMADNTKVQLEQEINSHLEEIDGSDRLELREEKTLQIDGHDAYWLTIVNTWEYEDPGTTYIHEFIYLLAEDRYYTITLYIPESEVDGRFHQEFKAMVESIQFLP